MSDLRHDPITGHWVAVATQRIERPMEYEVQRISLKSGRCPFCLGHEADTPEPVLVVGNETEADSGSEWIVRVIPNKYPSFPQNGPVIASAYGPYARHTAHGAQEVIVHSPRHVESFSQLNQRELHAGFGAFRARLKTVSALPDVQHVMLFHNCRPEAGATLQHVHSQLIGTPLVPGPLKHRWERMVRHRRNHGESLLTTITAWELAEQVRVLETTDRFAVYCPFASRFGYQIWIVPLQPDPPFAELDDEGLYQLANLCRKYVCRIDQILKEPALNLLFHLAPRDYQHEEHWYVELFPRLSQQAGLEWGTGWWVNPYAPEEVAQQLRSQSVHR